MFRSVLFSAILCFSLECINSSSRRPAIVDITKHGENFHGHIHVDGNPMKLKLTRAETPIFTPEFRLLAATGDEWGNITYEEVKINVTHLEQDIYEDHETDAVFRVHQINGETRLHGIINNVHIAHNGQDHFAIVHDLPTTRNASETDYIPVEGPLDFDSSAETRQAATVYPEVYITVDNKMWRDLNSDDGYTLGYLSVFMRGVNNNYKTFDDPSIKYRVVTATICKNANAQPFIEKSRQSDGKYDIHSALELFAAQMYNSRNDNKIPKHDLAPLFSGEDFGATTGLAYMRGVCRDGIAKDRKTMISYRTSVSRDRGGAYAGIHTVSHEFAHNMGSPHDGEKSKAGESPPYDTTGCPWDNGYIMSYIWNAKNKLRFSSCSRFYMRELLRTKNSDCVKSSQASSTWGEASRDPGAYMTMDEQCRRREGRSDAKVYRKSTPDELCLELRCEWPSGNGGWTSRGQRARALDGSSCGTGGKTCQGGRCA